MTYQKALELVRELETAARNEKELKTQSGQQFHPTAEAVIKVTSAGKSKPEGCVFSVGNLDTMHQSAGLERIYYLSSVWKDRAAEEIM